MISDDFKFLRAIVSAQTGWNSADGNDALERIRDAYMKNLKAAERLTDLANRLAKVEGEDRGEAATWAMHIRVALGDAYLGGPLK